MYNYFMLIGTLFKVEKSKILLRVTNEFAYADGTYGNQDLEIKLNEFLTATIAEYEGTKVAVKGRICMVDGRITLTADRVMMMGLFK